MYPLLCAIGKANPWCRWNSITQVFRFHGSPTNAFRTPTISDITPGPDIHDAEAGQLPEAAWGPNFSEEKLGKRRRAGDRRE